MSLLQAVGETAGIVGAALLMLAGLAGSVIPSLPGPPLVFAGVLVFALVTGFEPVGWVVVLVLGVLAAVSQLLDYLASALGAKRFGGTAWGAWGSVLGGLAGLLFGSLPGMIAGIFLGAFALELLFGNRDPVRALKVGGGGLLGFLGGTLMKVVFSLLMIGLFLFDLFLRG